MRLLVLVAAIGLLTACASLSHHDAIRMPKKEYFEDIISARFLYIPAGTFMMGSRYAETMAPETEKKFFADEAPIHEVLISAGFWLSETEVTGEQFKKFINDTDYVTSAERNGESLGKYSIATGVNGKRIGGWANGKQISWLNPGFEVLSAKHPVTHVSWEDADAYCRWLSYKTGKRYRLPTEAEWEYAAGGPERELYSWGMGHPSTARGGNIADAHFIRIYPDWKYPVLAEYEDGFPNTAPVASYSPNGFGIYDMTGNVWEWTSDYYSPSYYQESPAVDPQGPQDGTSDQGTPTALKKRVHRGGGFDWELPYLRVAKRRSAAEDYSAINIGFRIACDD